MSYQKTFFVSQALNGANASHRVYKLSFKPLDTSNSLYASHFKSCLTAKLVSAHGTLLVTRQPADKVSPYATAAIVADTNKADTVHGLAHGSKFAFGDQSLEFDLVGAIGVRSVLKGIFDVGECPALHVAVACDGDMSGVTVCQFSMKFTVEFSGESDAVAFEAALGKAA